MLPSTRLGCWSRYMGGSWKQGLRVGYSRHAHSLGSVSPWGWSRRACWGVWLRGDLHHTQLLLS